MGISKNEIIEVFARELEAAEEYHKPLSMSKEQYEDIEKENVGASGETKWEPAMPEPLQPKWVQQWGDLPKPIPVQSGESKIHALDIEDNSDIADAEYRYSPEEKPYRGPWHPERRPEYLKRQEERRKQKRSETPKEEMPEQKYSDEEYFKMAKEEPEHVVTNLVLQREAPYNQFKYIYPLAKSLVNWMSEMNYSPDKGSMLYEETKYMLDIIEQEAERKEREETGESPPISGETEWKPE